MRTRPTASTVAEYLDGVPPERRAALVPVRETIVRNLPAGYREGIAWGMITYAVPLERYPDTYNGQPLCYAALAAQKNYCALYLMGVYGDPAQAAVLRAAFARAQKKLDMGKSCLRFRSAGDLPLDDIGRLIAGMPPEALIAQHEAARARTARPRRTTRPRPPSKTR